MLQASLGEARRGRQIDRTASDRQHVIQSIEDEAVANESDDSAMKREIGLDCQKRLGASLWILRHRVKDRLQVVNERIGMPLGGARENRRLKPYPGVKGRKDIVW